MRLLILFLTLLSVAAGLTLQKTDGTTIELSDEPMVIDGSEVIMPQEMFASASRVKLDGISEIADVSTADINPFPVAVRAHHYPLLIFSNCHLGTPLRRTLQARQASSRLPMRYGNVWLPRRRRVSAPSQSTSP